MFPGGASAVNVNPPVNVGDYKRHGSVLGWRPGRQATHSSILAMELNPQDRSLQATVHRGGRVRDDRLEPLVPLPANDTLHPPSGTNP